MVGDLTLNEKYELQQRMDDLLDDYRDETACRTYNGWTRFRDPEDIRIELELTINFILGLPND